MTVWKTKVNVSAAFRDDDSKTFEQRRDYACKKLRKLLPDTRYEILHADEETVILWDLVDELADVDDEDYFDAVWDQIYDWADRNRVWIETRQP